MSVVSNVEQWLLELINRARLDPLFIAEYLGIDLNDGLPPGTISARAKQPLAASTILGDTADYHAAWVLAHNSLSTIGELGSNAGDRMAYAGFNGGSGFAWAENIAWRQFPLASGIDEEGVAQGLFETLFLSASGRAALLADNINEIGLSFSNGPISGTNQKAYVLNEDLGDSDAVFITGAAYRTTNHEFATAILPDGVGGVTIRGVSGATQTAETGGYALQTVAGQQRVQVGGKTVIVTVDDENIKLDIITGSDVLRSSHTLKIVSTVRQVELIGSSDADLSAALGAGAVRLLGNKGDNRLTGNFYSNTLDGRGGDDTMIGGYGDDTYYVDSVTDKVIERSGQGFDRVLTTSSFKLSAGSDVELISAEPSIFSDPIDLTGNLLSQELRGNHGNNRLDGGGGGDVLAGYIGDDVYIIRHAADRIIDDQGTDVLMAAVSFSLGSVYNDIELLKTIKASATTEISLTGNGANQTIEGNAGRNILKGMGGDDILRGGAGDDVLDGGTGRDTLYGGTGSDKFRFTSQADSPAGSNFDMIRDWSSIDYIDVSALDADSGAVGKQVLNYVGLVGSATALGLGQIGYYQTGGNTYVVANTDADDAAEFLVQIAGMGRLAADDFILV